MSDVLDRIYQRMYFDKAFFAETLLSDTTTQKTPDFHKQIYNALDSDERYIAFICPRGHAKSTTTTKIHVIHQICFGLANFIVIISESHDQSKDLLKEVKDELEYNEKIHQYFGKLGGEDVCERWTEGDIITANGIRVLARGSRQRIRGIKFRNNRPDWIILDDFESESNTETPEQRDKLKKWIDGSVLPAIDPLKGKIVLIGTIVHEDSYLNNIKEDKEGKMGWKCLEFKALYRDKDGNIRALWPERYSVSYLNKLREKAAHSGREYLFFQEYMNEPMPPGGGLVKPDWIKYKNTEIEYEEGIYWVNEDGEWVNAAIFVALDPSTGKIGGDMTGIAVLLVTSTGNYYIVEAEGKRLDTLQLVNEPFEIRKRWKFPNLDLETVAFQEVIKDNIYAEMRRRKEFFGITEHNPRTRKSDRLQGLVPFYASGRVYHLSHFLDYETQLRNYPKAKHDDILDAAWYCFKSSYIPSKIERKKFGAKNKPTARKVKYNWAVL
jgi:phage terminase large subunit-like protein